MAVFARPPHQLEAVFGEDPADVHLLHQAHQFHEVPQVGHRLVADQVEGGLRHRAALVLGEAQAETLGDDLQLLPPVGIVQPMAEHEAVELRLGQLEGAGLLHGILGGDGQKRRRQPEACCGRS